MSKYVLWENTEPVTKNEALKLIGNVFKFNPEQDFYQVCDKWCHTDKWDIDPDDLSVYLKFKGLI